MKPARVRLKFRHIDWLLLLGLLFGSPFTSRTAWSQSPAYLSSRNLEAPFPYLSPGQREWPILERPWPAGTRASLTARDGKTVLAEGERIELPGLQIEWTATGTLRVRAAERVVHPSIRLQVRLQLPDGTEEQQMLEIRAAPPDRPISYYSDFGDDLIRIFMDSKGKFRPIAKSGFDQFFRRLQAHGTRRLIVWMGSFPFIADPANYAPDDWRRYESQARAILDDERLTQSLASRSGLVTWNWLRYLMALRFDSEWGRMLGQSAEEHGIALSACYRPFESALSKYYEVPAFDSDGTYLWGFHPVASPTVNYQSDKTGWRHYRELLRELGRSDAAELESIELPGVTNSMQFRSSDDFQIFATSFPPLSHESLVLVRDTSGHFRLHEYADVQRDAENKWYRVKCDSIEASDNGIQLQGLSIPRDCRYLILSWNGPGDGPDLARFSPVVLRAQAGNRLGRETTYWVQGGPADPSRVAGITPNGEYWSEFQASQASQLAVAAMPERLTLGNRQLVIDLGASNTCEMIDFNQRLARDNAVREIATMLRLPGFDDVFFNTRSHVDLPLSLADGDQGIRPAGLYWHERSGLRDHLGLDRAYAPTSTASNELLGELLNEPGGVERITTWQTDEWREECQSKTKGGWRYARNRGTADGVRLLLEDFERSFPSSRLRVVLPPSEAAVQTMRAELARMVQPSGGTYGRRYFNQLWPGNNIIPSIGEGMAMVDLQGLSVEPVFLGSGGQRTPMRPFELYVDACVADLAGNRGSRFSGARSYFFEAQNSLRATDRQVARIEREEMIRFLLSHTRDIGEVILYESADWLYFLPLSDPELCGHGFLNSVRAPKVK